MTGTVTAIHPEIAHPDGVTAVELCARAGITYRQLDYWVRTDRLRPLGDACPGYGHSRLFAESEVEFARIGKQLIDAGFSLLEALVLARRAVDNPGTPIELVDGLVTINAKATAPC